MTRDNAKRFMSGSSTRLRAAGVILLCTTLQLIPATRVFSQSLPDFESRKQAAYQKFHHGHVREAGVEIIGLVKETPDKAVKAGLLRDLTEICTTAYELKCALDAETAAYQIANSEASLKPMLPGLFAYLLQAYVWADDADALKMLFKDNRVAFNPVATPYPSAIANVAAMNYFLRLNNYRLAEKAYSTAVISLLLTDPKDKYNICKTLVDLLEGLISQQDIVSAHTLARIIDPYINANLNHEGPVFAAYVHILSQLLAMTNRSKKVLPALEQAIQLNERLDINEGTKLYRNSTSNSLGSLLLLLDGTLVEAEALHARHPLQSQREAIVARGTFDTLQEFYFALSDVLITSLRDSSKAAIWKQHFSSLPAKWNLTGYLAENIESYRHFALGLITSATSRSDAAVLIQTAARERIEVFEGFLTHRTEGFQLPTITDLLVIQLALTSITEFPPVDAADLALKGSEMLTRSLRHQTSDFAVLIGAQKSERARDAVRSYYLLLQQKRQWEFDQIKLLLQGDKRDAGYMITTYSRLRRTISDLAEMFAKEAAYSEVVGYPTTAQIQNALEPNEVLLTFVPTLKGIGRLCISKTAALFKRSDVDPLEAAQDAKLLRLALTQERAAEETLDSQYPALSAVRLSRLLFEGLESCATPGSLVNIALPDELTGIPLAALLEEEPPKRGDAYDLLEAHWLGRKFQFATTISARHFLGTRGSIVHQHAPLPYLGVGNPSLIQLAGAADGKVVSTSRGVFGELAPLPETADEIRSVATLLQASKTAVLLGPGATEEHFRSKDLGKYDIIHFATHGLLRDDLPGLNEAALVFTPSDTSDSFDDGLLTASEITRLPLDARLVVLSACNTARIDPSAASIGITDLAAAFSVAGAPTLLASLWTVESNAAHDVIVEFFTAWNKERRKSASAALSDGIASYLAKADRAHHHPRFWAPFIVFGYGAGLPNDSAQPLTDGFSYEPLPNQEAGEIMDAKPMADRLILSIMDDWDGHTMASTITEVTEGASRFAILRSHDIGAGTLLVDQSRLFAFGYKPAEHPYPIVRQFTADGSQMWERRWENAIDGMPMGSVKVGSNIVMLAASTFTDPKVDRVAHLIAINSEGNEAFRKDLKVGQSEFLVGKWAVLTNWGKNLALVINSRSFGQFGSREPLFGLPSLCDGPVRTTVYVIDPGSFEITNQVSFDDFQASAATDGPSGLIVGGEARGACDDGGKAALVRVTAELATSEIWRDDDVFPSSVQSIVAAKGRSLFAVKRQRPIGVRRAGATAPNAGSKRWGDTGDELLEFSIFQSGDDGKPVSLYNSSFGLSTYAQGIVLNGDKPIIYGSLGGRAAITSQR
ncbi:CHAT domain-containing protein [Bradyrhizobium sp. B124]|uniref:CHAT domain-containing protein n=1 Tax=Bradyrhizobium sp. B124 TaxID=3140245 RepID=UPI003183669A